MATKTHNGQTEYEILTRIGIPLVLGDKTWQVKPRTMKQDRLWLAQVEEKIVALMGGFDKLDSISAIIAGLGEATPDMLALIFAYDLTKQLDHEWIEENVMSREITTAFTVLVEEAYPPFAVSRRLAPKDQAASILGKLISWAIDTVLVKGSASPEPTSSPSTNGDTEPPDNSTTA